MPPSLLPTNTVPLDIEPIPFTSDDTMVGLYLNTGIEEVLSVVIRVPFLPPKIRSPPTLTTLSSGGIIRLAE